MDQIYSIILPAHSGWRWIVLVFLVLTTLKVLIGWLGNQNWKKLDAQLVWLTNLVVSIQVLLGIILYILVLFRGQPDIGSFTGEHVFPAFLSLAGTGFALGRSRKASGSRRKFMFASIGMIITAILIYIALLRVGGPFV